MIGSQTNNAANLPDAGALTVPSADAVTNTDWGDVIGNKTDTTAGDSIVAMVKSLGGSGESHTPLFTGSIWYVDAAAADDTGSGGSPEEAKKTLLAGIALMSAGDALTVKAGDYDENGLALALDALELWCEIGVTIANTEPGTVLTVSGASCLAQGVRTAQAGQIGIHVTGARCKLECCRAAGGPTIGFDLDGGSVTLKDCYVGQATITGYDSGANGAKLTDCHSVGPDNSTRGFYVSAGLRGQFIGCTSVNNGTAGFETAAGANLHLFKDCVSGGGDGDRVDSGVDNFWPGFVDRTRRERHEHIYPTAMGEGVASDPVTVSNAVTDDSGAGPWGDKNYWGDTVRIIPPDILTTIWYSIGIYIHATTAADVQPWEIFFTNYHYEASRAAGNTWDYQETALTVADATAIEAGDKVWITGTGHLDGEICDVVSVVGSVVTIASETRKSADTGLKYDYTGAEKMYVVYRADNRILHFFTGDHSASSAREFARFVWSKSKGIEPDGGMIMRMANATDDVASSFDVRAIYED